MITDIQKTIRELDSKHIRTDLAKIRPGQRVRIHFQIREGQKERIQVFQGDIIRIKHLNSLQATFTVRKVSYGVGVERTFPLHSPLIAKIEVMRQGRVRRAKLYYLRDRIGKATRLKEVITRKKKK